MSENVKSNQKIADTITKDTGGVVFYAGGMAKMKGIEWIDSGSPKFNMMLSGSIHNGYPRGRMIELIGHESGGKTTMAMIALIKRQQSHPNEKFGMIDSEHAFDMNYYKKFGLKEDSLFICQPDNGEEALSVAEGMIDNGFSIVIIDSVASLVPKAELEGDIGDSHMALQARMMSQALRILTGKINNSNTLVIFINQWRQKIGGYGDSRVAPGGNSLKFYASQRVDLSRGLSLKNGEIIYGNTIKSRLIKSKVSNPFTTSEINLIYGFGIDVIPEVVEIASEAGVITKSGSWYSYGDTKLGQGVEAASSILRDNPELLEEIKSKIF